MDLAPFSGPVGAAGTRHVRDRVGSPIGAVLCASQRANGSGPRLTGTTPVAELGKSIRKGLPGGGSGRRALGLGPRVVTPTPARDICAIRVRCRRVGFDASVEPLHALSRVATHAKEHARPAVPPAGRVCFSQDDRHGRHPRPRDVGDQGTVRLSACRSNGARGRVGCTTPRGPDPA